MACRIIVSSSVPVPLDLGLTKKLLFPENLTSGLSQPCVMDIKPGRRTWPPEATREKIARQGQSFAEKQFCTSVQLCTSVKCRTLVELNECGAKRKAL